MSISRNFVVLISADAEWRAVRESFPDARMSRSQFGEWFITDLVISSRNAESKPNESYPGESFPVIFFQGGWGKVAAAASAQYIIDHWSPSVLINLGTCGGFAGEIERGTIILADKTVIYDIIEQMGDYEEHIAHYTTDIDLSWLGEDFPPNVRRTLLVSADRDLMVEEIPDLKNRYHAVAGDWESGAIGWVAARNHTRCLILRGVTDLVAETGGEAYGKLEFFQEATTRVMRQLIMDLPKWIARLS